MDIKGCIFDLDGVVVDTAKYHYLAWKKLGAELGFDFTEQDNERLKGVSRMRSLDILLEIGGLTISQEEKEAAATKKNEWYLEFIHQMQPDEILPGVLDFFNQLKENNIKIALGSASKNAVLILDILKIKDYFDVIVDGNSVSKAKPDPEVFTQGAEKMGLTAAECVVFEDAEAGVEAAKNGGMRCVGIGEQDVLSLADVVVSGFTEFNIENLKAL
ncbi:beta-phosphoglucomutase [Persicobacter sp. CCB-QB2]|uniref:beta-phosphoglucomutase n=1 Tax=Persicobacter sp. CCB-QB2 TaxID=1561025 RepID=UPI0006A9AFEF|nr:beta-phosphoglucomutase [Persicobacter sp. CCB-QB2]